MSLTSGGSMWNKKARDVSYGCRMFLIQSVSFISGRSLRNLDHKEETAARQKEVVSSPITAMDESSFSYVWRLHPKSRNQGKGMLVDP